MAAHTETYLRISFGLLLTVITILQAKELNENDRYTHTGYIHTRGTDFHLVNYGDVRLLRVKRDDTSALFNATSTSTSWNDVSTSPVPDTTTDTTSPSNYQTQTNAQTTSTIYDVTTTSEAPTSTPNTSETTSAPTSPDVSTPPPTQPTETFPPGSQILEDDHKYYKSVVEASDSEWNWVDLNSMESSSVKIVRHGILSDSHRTAATVKLSFKLPFYGHYIDQVTIATGGFIYMSSFLHQWLTATQYVAPLMANFDTKLGSDNSNVHFVDNGTAFAVQWSDVQLQDDNFGPFTFQAVLSIDGTIMFNYKTISRSIQAISVANHPVKVGVSDAYYIDAPIDGRPNVHRRTIYEYHRVEIRKDFIKNGTTVYIRPLPTCIQMQNCSQCFSPVITSFRCAWCQDKMRCSDGMDRNRQDWFDSGCSTNAANGIADCARLEQQSRSTGVAVGIVVCIFVLVFIVLTLAGWFYYAYRNPTTRSGMWLMEHRPSQLKMKMKFWKKEGGDKYAVSVESTGNESTA